MSRWPLLVRDDVLVADDRFDVVADALQRVGQIAPKQIAMRILMNAATGMSVLWMKARLLWLT